MKAFFVFPLKGVFLYFWINIIFLSPFDVGVQAQSPLRPAMLPLVSVDVLWKGVPIYHSSGLLISSDGKVLTGSLPLELASYPEATLRFKAMNQDETTRIKLVDCDPSRSICIWNSKLKPKVFVKVPSQTPVQEVGGLSTDMRLLSHHIESDFLSEKFDSHAEGLSPSILDIAFVVEGSTFKKCRVKIAEPYQFDQLGALSKSHLEKARGTWSDWITAGTVAKILARDLPSIEFSSLIADRAKSILDKKASFYHQYFKGRLDGDPNAQKWPGDRFQRITFGKGQVLSAFVPGSLGHCRQFGSELSSLVCRSEDGTFHFSVREVSIDGLESHLSGEYGALIKKLFPTGIKSLSELNGKVLSPPSLGRGSGYGQILEARGLWGEFSKRLTQDQSMYFKQSMSPLQCKDARNRILVGIPLLNGILCWSGKLNQMHFGDQEELLWFQNGKWVYLLSFWVSDNRFTSIYSDFFKIIQRSSRVAVSSQ